LLDVAYFRDEIGEVLARELYLSAELDPTHALGAPRVATAVLGESCLHTVRPRELPGPALIQRDGPRWIIHVREGLTPSKLNQAVAHELGEWFLRCRGYAEPDVEELSSRVAAAICVPRPAFMAVHGQIGEDLAALSQRFLVSESLMALRLAECLGSPTALITQKVVLTRGEPWGWPTTRQGWADFVASSQTNQNGLTIRSLSDSIWRLVLRLR
jgi:hypothetical protein